MNYIGANVVAILAATIVGLAIGTAYASFSTRFRRKQENVTRGRTIGLLSVAFIAEFWLASILAGALILAPPQAGAWTMALGSAVIIWIGFVGPIMVVSYEFHRMGRSVLLLDCTHWLAVMLSQAAILHLFGLTRP